MSTADSALLAFSSMWVRDMFKPYIAPRSSETTQLWFGRAMAVVGLTIGVSLGLLTIEKGFPNLTGLFSLQNVRAGGTCLHTVLCARMPVGRGCGDLVVSPLVSTDN